MNEKFYRSSLKNRTEIGGQYKKSGGAVFQSQCARLKRVIRASFLCLVYRSIELWSFGAFIQMNYTVVRDFPAEGLYTTLLLVTLFQKDRLPRVRCKVPSCGQDDIPGTVGYLNATS
jgi:hypothetical protein